MNRYLLTTLTVVAVVMPLTAGFWVAQQPSYTGTAFAEEVVVSSGKPHVLLLNFSLAVMEVRGVIYAESAPVTYTILDAASTRLQPPAYEGRLVLEHRGRRLHEVDWKPTRSSVYFLVISSEEPTKVFYWLAFLAPYFFGPTQQVALGLWLTSATSACVIAYLAPRRRVHHWQVGVVMIVYSLTFLTFSLHYEFLGQTASITYLRTGGVYTLLNILLLTVGVLTFLTDLKDLLKLVRRKQ